MSLTGSGNGPDRNAIIKGAKETAEKYYNTSCVGVTLTDETALTIADGSAGNPWATVSGGFSASWEALIQHNYWPGSYGIIECRHCKARK